MSNILFLILSYFYGSIISIIGTIIALILKLTGHKCYKYIYSYIFEIGENWGGASMGPFIIVNKNPTEQMLNHEFGHSLQNCYLGNYMIIIAIMSSIRWWYRKFKKNKETLKPYDSIWFEGTATYLGTHYKNNILK